jgi:hypothetical protein
LDTVTLAFIMSLANIVTSGEVIQPFNEEMIFHVSIDCGQNVCICM